MDAALRIDDVLSALNGMNPAQRFELVKEADKVVGDFVWLPNPGPQLQAYFCEADELFYGGQAGGGKTDLVIGLALTAHERSLILREFNNDARSMGDRLLNIVGSSTGWNGQLLRYKRNNKLVEFGGCQYEEDKQRYKGVAHDFKCVAKGTRVVMGDGSLREIECISAGDLVATLEGPRRVQRIYPTRQKECVEITCGSARQVQSNSHAILTDSGWSSAASQDAAYEPSECYGIGKSSQSYSAIYALRVSSLLRKIGRFVHTLLSCPPSPRPQFCLADGAYEGLPTTGTGSVAFGGLLSAWKRLALLSFLAGQRKQIHVSGASSFCQTEAENEVIYALSASSPRDLMGSYSGGIHQYDEHIPEQRMVRRAPVDDQRCLLLSAYAAQPTPTHWQDGDLAETQIYSHQKRKYAHPYTKEIRLVSGSGSLLSRAFHTSDAGIMDVYDIQVEEVNHYITEGGFVNKNCFDEIGDFTESQYTFICAWNRSATPGQRARVVVTGNPPTRAKGLWVIRRWGAWLDPKHPNPAAYGELRWYTTAEDGREIEVDGPGPHIIGGEEVIARSRTFIPAELSDNPDLAATNYSSTLSSLPKELRDAYRDGKFSASLKDQPFQLLPTDWLREAQSRWRPEGRNGNAMTAMAFDPAGGGKDSAEQAMRYGGWYAPLVSASGPETADGSKAAAKIIEHRRDNCPVIVDVGGGYGGAVTMRLKDNGVDHVAFNGANKSSAKTIDGKLGFINKRAEAFWKFREALDPDQEGGSVIAIPHDDSELFADLCSYTWEITAKGIKIVDKDTIRELIGRSPGRGDAVVMCLSEWTKAVQRSMSHLGRAPKVIMGRNNARR